MEPQWIYRAATLIWLVMAVATLALEMTSRRKDEPIEVMREALTLAGLLATFSLALAFIITGRIW